MFYNDGNIFCRSYIKAFDFIKWFDLNYYSDSLLKNCQLMIV